MAGRRRSIDRHLSGHGWRLSNSWARPGYGFGESSPPWKNALKPSEHRKDNLYTYFQSQYKAAEKEFDDFKRRVDDDPYGMLFGYTTWESGRKDHTGNKGYNTNSNWEVAKSSEEDVTMKDSAPDNVANNLAQEPKPQPSSYSETKPSVQKEIHVEDFVFDPISMRNVPKISYAQAPNTADKTEFSKSEFSSPLKTAVTATPNEVETVSPFHPSADVSSKMPSSSVFGDESQTAGAREHTQDWLVQEGFGARNPRLTGFKSGSNSEPHIQDIYLKPSKIETALDRHLRIQRQRLAENSKSKKQATLKYKSEEETAEDVDLLRASDVRTSAGLSARLPKETAKEKHDRRSALENDYEMRSQSLDAQMAEELTPQNAQLTKKFDEPSPPTGVGSESRPQQFSQRKFETNEKIAVENSLEAGVHAQGVATEVTKSLSDEDEKIHIFPLHHSPASSEGEGPMNVHNPADIGKCWERSRHARGQSELESQPTTENRVSDQGAVNIHDATDIGRYWEWSRHAREQQFEPQHQPTTKGRASDQGVVNIPQVQLGVINPQHLQSARQLEREDMGQHAPNSIDQGSMKSSLRILPTASVPHEISSNPSAKYPNSEDQETDRLEVIRITRKLINELRQTQRLFQSLRRQYQKKYPDAAIPINLIQSSKAYEQNFMQTLRGAWEIFKSGVESPNPVEDAIRTTGTSTTSVPPARDDNGINLVAKPTVPEESTPATPSLYRILAYDPTIQRVSAAKITSPSMDEKTLNLLETLSKLTAPAKFLPHLAALQKSGYELVSTSPTVLIFKKVRPGKTSTTHPTEDASVVAARYPRHTNPIDGTTTPTGNFASPTGFVNHDAPTLPPSEDDRPIPPHHEWSSRNVNGDTVHRQEEVFSNSRAPWQDHHRGEDSSSIRAKSKSKQRKWARRKRVFKRMFWGGFLAAGCCYTVGVASGILKA